MNFEEQKDLPQNHKSRSRIEGVLGKRILSDEAQDQEEIPIGILEVTAGEKDLTEENEEK